MMICTDFLSECLSIQGTLKPTTKEESKWKNCDNSIDCQLEINLESPKRQASGHSCEGGSRLTEVGRSALNVGGPMSWAVD